MPGDYTRFRFSPLKDASGIMLQQGSMILDQDWNELVEIIDRHGRAETLDTMGRAVAPKENAGFDIEIAGGNSLTIGPGRMYVDGMPAENHGAGTPQYDDKLDETPGSQPVPFQSQPYFPAGLTLPQPNPFTIPADNQPFLVYLDVWKREATSLQAPDIVDSAVGVGTATRLQTVWQVKILPGIGNSVNCSTPDAQVKGWADATARSAGQLTTAAAGVPLATDPCTIPPNGGYRGTENRTYRVEIHTPGPFGTAQFKWSRNNASVATRIVAVDSSRTVLTVVRTKRDSVLRFAPGSWVEVTDDSHEFASLPGEMHQVASVDDVNLTITLKTPLAAGAFDPNSPDRHMRVVLWDQSGIVRDPNNNKIVDVDSNGGLIPAQQNTTIVLEDGIQVTFTLDSAVAGGRFQEGDHWIFAARTADASIETLTNAPPRGIHHHYCRLAVVSFPNNKSDCRTFWPPDFAEGCECTACVTADDHNKGTFTIQMAIDQVKSTGGRVCLAPGIFNLQVKSGDRTIENGLTISGAQALRITGHGPTVLLAPPPDPKTSQPAILIDGSSSITFEDLTLVVAPGTPSTKQLTGAPAAPPVLNPGIMIQNSSFVTIRRCGFVSLGNKVPQNPAIAVGGFVWQTSIVENFITFSAVNADGTGSIGPGTGIAHLPTYADSPNILLITFDLYIRNNFIQSGSNCIYLDSLSYHAWQLGITENFMGPSGMAGITVAGLGLPAPESRIEITGNEVVGTGDGIVCGVGAARIENNDVLCLTAGQTQGDGIVLDVPLLPATLDGCQVVGNRITGVGGIGINISAQLGSAVIRENIIENAGAGGIVMTGYIIDPRTTPSSAQHLSVTGNQLLGLVPAVSNPLVAKSNLAIGILLQFVPVAEIEGNVVKNLGMDTQGNTSRVGIGVVACNSVRVSGNQIINIGPSTVTVGPSAGISIVGPPFDRAEVTGNTVRRTDSGKQGDFTSLWRGIYIGPLTNFASASNFTLVSTAGNRFAIIAALSIFEVNQGAQMVLVRGNFLDAFGFGPAAEIEAAGACTFSDNQCFLTGYRVPTVSIRAQDIVASANYVRTGMPGGAVAGAAESIRLATNTPQRAQEGSVILGNITDRGITINGHDLSNTQWNALNVAAL